ncbi:phage portal protein [Qingshengfaniella alkalisoli]|uniref:Phage portal protein n=1 Tax=Qingshengfaniella alkalisoli TaxID=2599296 RepID=A0A5B8ISV9_9RHOB|nr:phage portal protein [Qingshengfaniella alkalisoli]QDY69322.1 phage portal protein [Qingshengfaniella alkalisoli]
MFNFFKRNKPEPEETRSISAGGFTAQVMGAREAYISGQSGLGELTATVQSAVSLWENALSAADVEGTDLITRRDMALAARSLALRGEAIFYIGDDGLLPASDWELSTRNGKPHAYRLSLYETGGSYSVTALAAEVIHLRIGADPVAPFYGVSPLRRASLSADLLHTLETALAEVYGNAPLGSSVLPFPESPETDLEVLASGFRGRRGRVMLRESVQAAAAGGAAPAQDWSPNDLSPHIDRTMVTENLKAAKGAILNVYGVLPALVADNAQGPLVREAQRHLVQWTLQPIAMCIAEELTEKLGTTVEIDTARPLQAFDAGGRARAAATIVQAMAMAKEAGVDPDAAMKLVDWD